MALSERKVRRLVTKLSGRAALVRRHRVPTATKLSRVWASSERMSTEYARSFACRGLRDPRHRVVNGKYFVGLRGSLATMGCPLRHPWPRRCAPRPVNSAVALGTRRAVGAGRQTDALVVARRAAEEPSFLAFDIASDCGRSKTSPKSIPYRGGCRLLPISVRFASAKLRRRPTNTRTC